MNNHDNVKNNQFSKKLILQIFNIKIISQTRQHIMWVMFNCDLYRYIAVGVFLRPV